ncbi:NifB/NifX family molybdenum-iron cluster-binding protein [Salinispira pacifica]|uniref:Glycine-rich cell wall structural protein n=1 Tax=Salinispira pacifica TaxID=1307761 RepID=V5WJD3_9SPIO|nr:NifB/NifX family molybdenum-iron cluster-binding protein [Salinispira pacifica]AHC15659.1 Glycine-rich cell wall structural protein precursor [Salinispira pacifica]
MILGFCLSSENPDAPLDTRFGRAAYFTFIDSDTSRTLSIMENPGKHAAGSAGMAAVQIFADHRADVIIGPRLGPKAEDAARALGLTVYSQGDSRNVSDALQRFHSGSLVSS